MNRNGKVAGMGITHPSVSGQERVVRMAYQKASLEQSKTAYLECHGTGTPVGDPIEARAVSNAMNDTRSPEKPLIIGAIKASKLIYQAMIGRAYFASICDGAPLLILFV